MPTISIISGLGIFCKLTHPFCQTLNDCDILKLAGMSQIEALKMKVHENFEKLNTWTVPNLVRFRNIGKKF